MALPLRKTDSSLPETPGPKIVPMPVYEFDVQDVDDAVTEEVEFVLQRAAASQSDTLHDLGNQVASAVDRTMQRIAASSADRIDALQKLAKADPIRFISTVAAVAFVAGFGLRLWRSSRG